jgi:O-antigen/teichoic acid export membrane protein
MLLNFLYISLNAIFAPMISHFYGAGEHDQLEKIFKTSASWMLTLSLPIYLAMVFFSGDILGFFGPAFLAGRPALILMATGFLVHVAIGSTEYVLMMTGRQKWIAASATVMATVAIALGVWLVPRYGFLAAAIINSLIIILGNVVTLVLAYRLLNVHPFHARYFRVLLFGAVTGLAVAGLRWGFPAHGAIGILLIQAAVLFTVYGSLVLLFGLDPEERVLLGRFRDKLKG